MSVLFTIETSVLRLSWSQVKNLVPMVSTEAPVMPYGLTLVPLQPGIEPTVSVGGRGCLYEQTDYTLFVQSRTGASIAVRHRDPVITRGLHRSDAGRVVHGTVNFGAQVGESRFVVEADGLPHLAFEVEVYPSKLDYREDYAALQADLQELAHGLVLAYLRATYRTGAPAPEEASSSLAWALLLRGGMDALEQALAYLEQHPVRDLLTAPRLMRVEAVRRPDATLLRAIRQGRGRGAWLSLKDGHPVRARLLTHHPGYTMDTPEHRWLATRLAQLQARLQQVRDAEAQHGTGLRHAAVQRELADLQRRLARATQHLAVPAETSPSSEPSLRLMTAPGYREAYRLCVLLQHGLGLQGAALQCSLKDLHQLYEYWCYLTLVRLAAGLFGQDLPLRALLAVEHDGLRLRLRKGRAQTVTFEGAKGGRLVLTYNPRFSGKDYLVPQQPDILITVSRPGAPPLRYILDAKYRLDGSPSYRKRYGTPGPPADALNDLHRYRDALRGRKDGDVLQAVALFPYREEHPGAFNESRHGRLLPEIGVGAIPLLPGATDYLEAWLRTVLADGVAFT